MTLLDAAQTGAAILAVLVSAYAGWAGARKSLADARKIAEPPPPPTTPYEAMVSRLTSLEVKDADKTAQIGQLQVESSQLRAENSYLQASVDRLEDRVSTVEDDRSALASALGAFVEWEDQGRPDPPGAPTVTDTVRAILNRVH